MATTSFSNCTEYRINVSDQSTGYKLKLPDTRGANMYYDKPNYEESTSAMVLSCYFYEQGTWKWKGTAPVRRIQAYETYIKVTTWANEGYSNGTLGNEGFYWFTIGGFF